MFFTTGGVGLFGSHYHSGVSVLGRLSVDQALGAGGVELAAAGISTDGFVLFNMIGLGDDLRHGAGEGFTTEVGIQAGDADVQGGLAVGAESKYVIDKIKDKGKVFVEELTLIDIDGTELSVLGFYILSCDLVRIFWQVLEEGVEELVGVFKRGCLDFFTVVGGDYILTIAFVAVVVEGKEIFAWFLFSDETAVDEFS